MMSQARWKVGWTEMVLSSKMIVFRLHNNQRLIDDKKTTDLPELVAVGGVVSDDLDQTDRDLLRSLVRSSSSSSWAWMSVRVTLGLGPLLTPHLSWISHTHTQTQKHLCFPCSHRLQSQLIHQPISRRRTKAKVTFRRVNRKSFPYRKKFSFTLKQISEQIVISKRHWRLSNHSSSSLPLSLCLWSPPLLQSPRPCFPLNYIHASTRYLLIPPALHETFMHTHAHTHTS